MKVLVVMISWSPTPKRLHLCERTLRSLRAHTKAKYELAVVDNGPESQTEMLRQQMLDYHLIQENNVGISRARNIGATANPHLPYIAFIDSDLEFTEGWLTKALDYLVARRELRLIVTCRRSLHMDKRINCLGVLDGWSIWPVAAGGALVMPRSAYDTIGPWPETWRMGFDMAMAARRANYSFVLPPKPLVLHAIRGSSYRQDVLQRTGQWVAVGSKENPDISDTVVSHPMVVAEDMR